ncbi:MAG: hypothetical protein M1816_003397 [Peltula sp. TS41687]|nr:MAG: hypothetical protein M1816_003397 [Peltula sp. TS41687]
MNISSHALPAFRSPVRPGPSQVASHQVRRVNSSSSNSSSSSQDSAFSADRKPEDFGRHSPPKIRRSPRKTGNVYDTGSPNFSRPSTPRGQVNEQAPRGRPPLMIPGQNQLHQVPQHAQGFFVPTLRTTSSSSQPYTAANLTASQIAAQAAMQHQTSYQHLRKRSQTVPNSQSPVEGPVGFPRGHPQSPVQNGSGNITLGPAFGVSRGPQYHNNSVAGGHTTTAASAASAAYPRSTLSSPGLPSPERPNAGPEKEVKQKSEKSKLKFFSKPKSIGISRDKEAEQKDKALPSPNKMGVYGPSPLSGTISASTTSLADTFALGAPSSLYGMPNASTTTLLPPTEANPTSEKHKHHFLSRTKHKHKDKDDHHSSAVSNSKPLDLTAPPSLPSFSPSSPGFTATSFAKTVSGFDLRHGGRALREKKREEKASAAANAAIASNAGLGLREDDLSSLNGDWPGSLNISLGPGSSVAGTPKAGSLSMASGVGNDPLAYISLQGFGLPGMTPDDAWPYLKAKLLTLFEGGELRIPIEDLNLLVLAHLHRYIQARAPHMIIDDLQDFLYTGFSSLDQALRRNSEERLIPGLVDVWLAVFGTILPYLQAVFFPLDQEFRGTGSLMSAGDAQSFWGALPADPFHTPLGGEPPLEVRRIVLTSFRDCIILPRYDTLQAVFSRLSLASINGSSDAPTSLPDGHTGDRPGTAASLDPGTSSFNSQGTTLLSDSINGNGARSRTTSNTSSGVGVGPGNTSSSSVGSDGAAAAAAPSPPAPYLRPPAETLHPMAAIHPGGTCVTETVGRMLQCVSVLASMNSGDEAQRKMEDLAKTLKHNWLGRGRTGRNRKGFVGTKLTTGVNGAGLGSASAGGAGVATVAAQG